MTQQLTRYEAPELDTMQLGQVLAKSGYFQDTRDAAQAIVKVLAGREMGIGAIAAMTGIYIVKGRITLSANLMAAQIKRSGRYNYIIRRMDDTGCEIEYFEGQQSIGRSSFDEGDAKQAGLLGGENWRKFPRNMYFARAMSNGAKWICPDVFSGPVYTPDELTNEANGAEYVPQVLPPAPAADPATGEVVDAPQLEAPAAEPLSDRAVRIAQLKEAIVRARDAGHKIAPITFSKLTDDEISAKSDELLRLFSAELPVGLPEGEILANMRQ